MFVVSMIYICCRQDREIHSVTARTHLLTQEESALDNLQMIELVLSSFKSHMVLQPTRLIPTSYLTEGKVHIAVLEFGSENASLEGDNH